MLSLFLGGLQELLVQVLHVVLLLSVGVFRNEPKLASEVFLHEQKKMSKTSMHSSRIHIARMLPISPSMHCTLRSAPGCVSGPGGSCWGGLLGGVSGPRGVCIPACNGADIPPVDRQTPAKT